VIIIMQIRHEKEKRTEVQVSSQELPTLSSNESKVETPIPGESLNKPVSGSFKKAASTILGKNTRSAKAEESSFESKDLSIPDHSLDDGYVHADVGKEQDDEPMSPAAKSLMDIVDKSLEDFEFRNDLREILQYKKKKRKSSLGAGSKQERGSGEGFSDDFQSKESNIPVKREPDHVDGELLDSYADADDARDAKQLNANEAAASTANSAAARKRDKSGLGTDANRFMNEVIETSLYGFEDPDGSTEQEPAVDNNAAPVNASAADASPSNESSSSHSPRMSAAAQSLMVDIVQHFSHDSGGSDVDEYSVSSYARSDTDSKQK